MEVGSKFTSRDRFAPVFLPGVARLTPIHYPGRDGIPALQAQVIRLDFQEQGIRLDFQEQVIRLDFQEQVIRLVLQHQVIKEALKEQVLCQALRSYFAILSRSCPVKYL
jgi:hypothetical protein